MLTRTLSPLSQAVPRLARFSRPRCAIVSLNEAQAAGGSTAGTTGEGAPAPGAGGALFVAASIRMLHCSSLCSPRCCADGGFGRLAVVQQGRLGD